MAVTERERLSEEADLELQEVMGQRPGVSLRDAMAAAEDGEPLELDLLMSGFYEGAQAGQADDVRAKNEVAMRSLGDLLARMREGAVARRWSVDENTLLNMAFRHGHQYVEVDRGRRAVVERPAPKNAVRRQVQKFEPWFRQHHGRLTQGKPRYTMRPTTGQQQDRDAVGFGKKLAEWLQPVLFSLHNRGEAAMWKLLAGKAIYMVTVRWVRDDSYMVDPTSGEPLHRPEVDVRVLPPQVCWCDDRVPLVGDTRGQGEQMRWFGYDRHVPLAEALASYPDAAEFLVPAHVAANRGHHVLRRVQGFHGSDDRWASGGTGGGAALSIDEEEETTVAEFWLRPGSSLCGGFLDWLDPAALGAPVEIVRSSDEGGYPIVRFPKGLRVCFTPDGRILEAGENIHGYLPFVGMSFSKSPGFWSYAPATPMRELQMAFNWVFSTRELGAIKAGNAPLMQPREARMSRRGGITNALARVYYRANRWGAKPEYLTPPQMGVDVAALQTSLEIAWQDIGGIHEVSQAKLPSADLSGVTVSLLQESDLAQLGYAGEEQEAAFVEVLRMALLSIQQFFPSQDPRLLQLAGDGLYMLAAFMQADLRHGLDLACIPGSAVPQSPAALEARAREAWEGGWMLDEYGRPDHRRMSIIFGFGSEDDLYADEAIDVANARRVEDLILGMNEQNLSLVYNFIAVTASLPQSLRPRPEDDPFVTEREHRMRLKRLQGDPRAHPLAVELLRLRWRIIAQTIAPILAQTDPALAITSAGAPGEDDGGGDPSSEGPPQAPAA